MNEFRLIIDGIRLPAHIDPVVAERFYYRAVDAVTEQLRALEATPGFFRWMKAMERLGEDIADAFDKPALGAAETPDPPPTHAGRVDNAPDPRAHANSGRFEPEDRL
jgi:hypothetical protein